MTRGCIVLAVSLAACGGTVEPEYQFHRHLPTAPLEWDADAGNEKPPAAPTTVGLEQE